MRNHYAFAAQDAGAWRVLSATNHVGVALEPTSHIDVTSLAESTLSQSARWVLRGVISNIRYAVRAETTGLKARQQGLGRPQATHAALIPIKKSAQWWDLPQDERRAIFEETSHHTAIGMDYLPAIARQLFHSRDLGEPFDFLTWFEYAPEHAGAFDELVGRLRATREWTYVEREIDIRLMRV